MEHLTSLDKDVIKGMEFQTDHKIIYNKIELDL